MTASKWGYWHWADGRGRWHAIAEVADGQHKLACGRVRNAPKRTAGRPEDEHCCPTCRELDDLRSAYKPETVDAPKETVPA